MIEKEVWKDIKGFEGVYQVSNLGRVRSLDRWVEHSYNGGWWKPGRIRKLAPTRGGYLFIPLSLNGVAYPKRVNRLVAEAFLDNYSEDMDIHHIDGDVTNNRADNLECLTLEEHHDKHPSVTVIGTNGENTIITQLMKVKDYGFDVANVSRCCKVAELEDGHPRKKKYATHKGYKWRYFK